jgi:uridine kinase
MPLRATPDEVIIRLAQPFSPPLIAIDGLPCSRKSTLANKIQSVYGFDCLYLDDFVRPEQDWPSRSRPAFPFEYIRYAEFINAVKVLASDGQCTYTPFDWETRTISNIPRTVTLENPVIVEGVSSLNLVLDGLYGLKIYVESDHLTILDVAKTRGTGLWTEEWRNLFLPSVEIYMESHPELRADLIVPGRGVL